MHAGCNGVGTGDRLTVLKLITPSRYSGAERIAVYLADGLQRRGHRVVFGCKDNRQLLEALNERNIEAHVLPISGKVNPIAPFMVAWFARWIDADIIHTHLTSASLWGAVAGKISGIPSIASVHALNSKTCYVYSDMLAACSEGVRQHLMGQGIHGERVRVMYNGLCSYPFNGMPSRDQMRAELDLPLDAPVIGEVAHLSSRKGQLYLLEAVALLLRHRPNLICLLVGEGEDHALLAERIEQLGIGHATRMLGYRPDARRVMNAMDLVVLPSVAIEGLGIALIEAAFLGKPVVGSDAPGIREALVDGETGLLAPPANAEALADAIETLLSDPQMARSMGEKGKRRAEDMFTLDHMVTRADELYRELLKEQSYRCGTY